MSSQINPSLINTAFPIAGVNNSTAGFRENYTAIAQNFVVAAREINDLMNKAVVTAPLTYGPTSVTNNFSGQPLSGAVLNDFSYAIDNHGTLSTTATEPFDFTLGYWHIVVLNGVNATTSLIPLNVPLSGYSQLKIQIIVNNPSHALNLSGLGTIDVSTAAGFNPLTQNLQFNAPGTYLLTLGSMNGEAWNVSTQNYAPVALRYTPSSQQGAAGDSAGMIAYDTQHVYVCTADFDGTTAIWFRSTLSW